MNFNTIGIICEYNPFHFGHKYHIEMTKKITGCKNIVCAMSGSMVQRGECAIFDKWSRAKHAIKNGADLVIEIPSYYVLQSADIYSSGAVKLMDSLKIVDALSFGSESGNIDLLTKISCDISNENSEYNAILKEQLQSGCGYPKASYDALKKCYPNKFDTISKPNDTLALCYIKALQQSNSSIKPICIKRNNNYNGQNPESGFLSACEIREKIINNDNYSKYVPYLPDEDIHLIKNAESFILGYLRMISTEKLSKIKGYEPGLSNLIIKSAHNSGTIEELIENCISRRYTKSRIKRYIMCAVLDIDYDLNVNYVRVLAANEKGIGLLNEIKHKSNLKIITKAADYKEKNKMFETDIKATDFFSLCSQNVNKRKSNMDFLTSPYIEKAASI